MHLLKIQTLLGMYAAVVSLLLIPYFFVFHSGFSTHHQDWASFGTYIGGVITPLSVIVALLALLQNEKSKQDDVKRMLAQTQMADILRFIERIESDIDLVLKDFVFRRVVGHDTYKHPGYELLFKHSMVEWETAIPTESDIYARLETSPEGLPRYDPQIALFEICGMVTAHILRLRDHCEKYDELSRTNVTSLYYARKYRLATERLHAKGYKIDVWEPST